MFLEHASLTGLSLMRFWILAFTAASSYCPACAFASASLPAFSGEFFTATVMAFTKASGKKELGLSFSARTATARLCRRRPCKGGDGKM
jgi:hypothetical protein